VGNFSERRHRLEFTVASSGDAVSSYLVIDRVLELSSQLDTIRILEELVLKPPSHTGIHRCLEGVAEAEYRDRALRGACEVSWAPQLTLAPHDVTTLFFRVEKEDDYRIRGLSKERHLGLQIVIGFLVDERGFPVQLHSFEGNKAETLTLVPVLDAFRRAHPNVTVSVACDAGMLSASNLTALEDAGYGFIVGSRIAKTPYDIAEYPNDGSALANGQILDTTVWFRRAGSRRQLRVVCQYRQKRGRLDLRNIDKQLENANGIIEGTSAMKKGRFLKVAGATKALDTALVTSAKSRAGVKGCVINLDTAPAEAIIDVNRPGFNGDSVYVISANSCGRLAPA
jgi:hypothetical protein